MKIEEKNIKIQNYRVKMSYSSDDEYEYEQDEIILHPTAGKYIINAVTGKQTTYLVGSKYESLFWKVLDVSISSYDPTPKNFMGSSRGAKLLFFSSPEDYEVIHGKTLDENSKISWRQNRGKISIK